MMTLQGSCTFTRQRRPVSGAVPARNEVARAHPACRDFVVAADPLQPDRVNVYDAWDAWAPLEALPADGPSPELAVLIARSAVREYTAAVLRPEQGHPSIPENS